MRVLRIVRADILADLNKRDINFLSWSLNSQEDAYEEDEAGEVGYVRRGGF